MESATTVDIGNSAITNGNEYQNKALFAAARCLHGGKRNRVGLGPLMSARGVSG